MKWPIIFFILLHLAGGMTLSPATNMTELEILQDVLDSAHYPHEAEARVFDCVDGSVLCTQFLQARGYDAHIMVRPDGKHAYVAVKMPDGWTTIETTSHMTKTMGVIVSTDVPGYWTGYVMGSVEEFYEKNSRSSEHEISELSLYATTR